MTNKTFKLSDAEFQQYQQLEHSITHWSVEYTKALLQTDRLKNAVNSMYEGRMQFMNTVLKEKEINPAHVHQVNVDSDDGTCTVSINADIPNPAADDSEAQAVNPTAPPVA